MSRFGVIAPADRLMDVENGEMHYRLVHGMPVRAT